MNIVHTPVLLEEVIQYLNPKPNQNFIDCTIGGAGHARAVLGRTGPEGKLLGIDWSAASIKIARENLREFGGRAVLVQGNFADLKKVIEEHHFKNVQGVLLDLGLSSFELESSGRGFSFLQDEPLDMRYGEKTRTTAAYIVNHYNEEDLARILRIYGEERKAREIARLIIEERKAQKIETTQDLVKIILKVASFQKGRIHPATKIFQALRIAVNNELENLRIVLPQALKILERGGRFIVISFHSLEDRIVKNFFRTESRGCLCPPEAPQCVCDHLPQIKILNKKPIKPKIREIKQNPRSRSALLRVAEKIVD